MAVAVVAAGQAQFQSFTIASDEMAVIPANGEEHRSYAVAAAGTQDQSHSSTAAASNEMAVIPANDRPNGEEHRSYAVAAAGTQDQSHSSTAAASNEMAVVPANEEERRSYAVAAAGQAQSHSVTAIACDENRAVAVHHQATIQEAIIVQETPSGVRVTRARKITATTIFAIVERIEMEGEEDDVDDYLARESCCEHCTDISCQACACQFQNLCKCSSEVCNTIKVRQILSDRLRRARNLGVKFLFLDGLIYPLLPHLLRDIVVGGELLYTIVVLILSIVNYAKSDCHRAFDWVNFTFGLVATLLSIASTIEAFYERNVCKKCFHKNDNENNDDKEDKKSKGILGLRRLAELVNLLRNVLAEFFIYPLLICSIFSLVSGRLFRSGTADDTMGLIEFVLSSFSFVAFVYILRLIILGGVIYNIHEKRKGTTATGKALYFLVYFFIHVALQMIVQSFMIVATGKRIYDENLHFFNNHGYNAAIQNYTDSESPCLPVRASGYLWYMIIGTYIFPIVGTLTFFLVAYYWTQEFYIEIFIMCRKMLETPGLDDTFQVKKKAREAVGRYFPEEKMDIEFNEFKRIHCCTKFIYPFKSPVMIIVCVAFLILIYFFLSFTNGGIYLLGPFSFTIGMARESTIGWIIVYIVGAIFGILANAYVFIVGIVWLFLLIMIVIILINVVPWIIFGCIIYLCCKNN